MREKEAIIARHSVRNYKPDKIEEEKASLLQQKIDELNAEGNLHLQFIEDSGKTYNKLLNRTMGLDSAPSVIACVGKDDDTLEERVGYYGEQLVLYAQSLGLNTCWAGIFSRKKIPVVVDPGEKIVISIAIGYGENQGQSHSSRPIDQISQTVGERPEWFEKGVEMALLAPTAMNQQKFVIKLNEDETVEFIDKGGFFSKVDLGIVRYHFEVGSGRDFCRSRLKASYRAIWLPISLIQLKMLMKRHLFLKVLEIKLSVSSSNQLRNWLKT